MADPKENSGGVTPPLPGGGPGSASNEGAVSASGAVASKFKHGLTLAGQPRKGPQGRPPGSKNNPGAMAAGGAAPGGTAAPAVAPAPVVDRPLVESLFESIIRGVDDHFKNRIKTVGAEICKHKFAEPKDILAIIELSGVKDPELMAAKNAFGAVCEKHGWLGQYVPEAILLALVGKMGAGWFLAQRRLNEIKVAIQAAIKKEQGKDGPAQ